MKNLKVSKKNLPKKIEKSIEKKTHGLKKKLEPIYDFDTAIWTGGLLELVRILVEFKTTNRNIRWYCCLRIYEFVDALQTKKNFPNEEIIEIFKNQDFDLDKVMKVLKEAKQKHEYMKEDLKHDS